MAMKRILIIFGVLCISLNGFAGTFMNPLKAYEVARRWFSFKGSATGAFTVTSSFAVFDTLYSDSITKFFSGAEPYKDIYFTQKPTCYLFNLTSSNSKKLCIMVGADSMYTPPIVLYTISNVENPVPSSFHPNAYVTHNQESAVDDWMRGVIFRMKLDIDNQMQYDSYSTQWQAFLTGNNDDLSGAVCAQGPISGNGEIPPPPDPNNIFSYIDLDLPSIFETKQTSRWSYKNPYFKRGPCLDWNNMGCVPLAAGQVCNYYKWPKAPNFNGLRPLKFFCPNWLTHRGDTTYDYDFDNWHYEDMAFRLANCHLFDPKYPTYWGQCPTCADSNNDVIAPNYQVDAVSKLILGVSGIINDGQSFDFHYNDTTGNEGKGVYLDTIGNPLVNFLKRFNQYNNVKYADVGYDYNPWYNKRIDTILLYQLHKKRPSLIALYGVNSGHMVVSTGYECKKYFTFAWGRGGQDDQLRLYIFHPAIISQYKLWPANYLINPYYITIYKDLYPNCPILASSDQINLNLPRKKASFNQVRRSLEIEGNMDSESDYMGFAGESITIQNEFEAAKGSTLYLTIETCGQ